MNSSQIHHKTKFNFENEFGDGSELLNFDDTQLFSQVIRQPNQFNNKKQKIVNNNGANVYDNNNNSNNGFTAAKKLPTITKPKYLNEPLAKKHKPPSQNESNIDIIRKRMIAAKHREAKTLLELNNLRKAQNIKDGQYLIMRQKFEATNKKLQEAEVKISQLTTQRDKEQNQQFQALASEINVLKAERVAHEHELRECELTNKSLYIKLTEEHQKYENARKSLVNAEKSINRLKASLKEAVSSSSSSQQIKPLSRSLDEESVDADTLALFEAVAKSHGNNLKHNNNRKLNSTKSLSALPLDVSVSPSTAAALLSPPIRNQHHHLRSQSPHHHPSQKVVDIMTTLLPWFPSDSKSITSKHNLLILLSELNEFPHIFKKLETVLALLVSGYCPPSSLISVLEEIITHCMTKNIASKILLPCMQLFYTILETDYDSRRAILSLGNSEPLKESIIEMKVANYQSHNAFKKYQRIVMIKPNVDCKLLVKLRHHLHRNMNNTISKDKERFPNVITKIIELCKYCMNDKIDDKSSEILILCLKSLLLLLRESHYKELEQFRSLIEKKKNEASILVHLLCGFYSEIRTHSIDILRYLIRDRKNLIILTQYSEIISKNSKPKRNGSRIMDLLYSIFAKNDPSEQMLKLKLITVRLLTFIIVNYDKYGAKYLLYDDPSQSRKAVQKNVLWRILEMLDRGLDNLQCIELTNEMKHMHLYTQVSEVSQNMKSYQRLIIDVIREGFSLLYVLLPYTDLLLQVVSGAHLFLSVTSRLIQQNIHKDLNDLGEKAFEMRRHLLDSGALSHKVELEEEKQQQQSQPSKNHSTVNKKNFPPKRASSNEETEEVDLFTDLQPSATF